jgi:hypothetical protein
MTAIQPLLGARIFVTIVFLLLGLSFPITTLVLADEFDADWTSLAAFSSHIFVFYPVFGVMALAAFYLPSIVFTDLYWRHLPYGRFRFILGAIVVSGAAVWIAEIAKDEERWSAWEFAPSVAARQLETAGCAQNAGAACPKGSLVARSLEVRDLSQGRIGLSKFARTCTPDPMLETPRENLENRYCVIAREKTTAAACCSAQKGFADAVNGMAPAEPSLTYTVHKELLPLKFFFLLVLIVIGLMLTFWLKKLDKHYAHLMPKIENNLLIGAFAMLFWPVMDFGHERSMAVLYGDLTSHLMVSLMVVPWALLLLFNFLRRVGERRKIFGRFAGGAAGALAIINSEKAIDLSSRFAGSGAGWIESGSLVLIVLATVALLMRPFGSAVSPKSNGNA